MQHWCSARPRTANLPPRSAAAPMNWTTFVPGGASSADPCMNVAPVRSTDSVRKRTADCDAGALWVRRSVSEECSDGGMVQHEDEKRCRAFDLNAVRPNV